MAFDQDRFIEEIKERERDERDDEAEGYIDYVENIYGPFRSRAYTITVLHFLNPRAGQIWLDAGSGVGRLSLELASKVEKVICIDHSRASLEVLKKNATKKRLANIETIHSDVCNFSGKDDCFDGILCNEVLQHIPSHAERLRCVKNLYRMLKPGGRCLINVIHWHALRGEEKEGYWGQDQKIYRYYFARDEIIEIMVESGFTNPVVRGLDIFPRWLSDCLPVKWACLDTWCSRIPISGKWGNNILTIGIKLK